MSSSAAPIPAAKAPFTAARAHSLATEKAARECASCKTSACKFCAGTGTAKITVETFGVAGSAHPVSLPCCYCKGGVINTQKELYNEYIWCACPTQQAGAFCAADGVRVFGNTTYLCRCCGLVSQFG
jgi:hypothetical protein